MKKVVKCLSCGEKVEVEPIPDGNGEIATCPVCGQLAYSSSEKSK